MPMGQHSHRNRFISTHPLGLNWMPSRSNKCCCSGQLGAGLVAVSMRQFVHGAEIAAALDAQTAHEITQDILSLTGITRVVVTHRLEASLLECYDEILVLKDGRIAETGTFSELVQHGGYFSAMYKLAH